MVEAAALGWSAVLLTLLAAIAWVDARRMIIPNALNAAVAGFGLLKAAGEGTKALAEAASAGLTVYLLFALLAELYVRWRDRPGLGLGDVKLLAAVSTWCGLAGVPVILLVGCASGLAMMAARGSLAREIGWQQRIAFGPHLATGTAFVWLAGLMP